MLLESKDIIVRRKGSPPLVFEDFTLKAGEAKLLLGPSGCGKTTLLSVLAGLLQPTSGSVFFEWADFYALYPKARDQLRGRQFGFVFQTLHLLPSLTLSQNIVLAADMAGARCDEGRLNDLLDRLGLKDKAHRKPDALSQGEQQRAAIARAVLLRPKLIIADEPTSALDDENAQAVMDLLMAQAKETGAALLMATHDQRIKDRFSQIVMLDNAMMREAA